MASYQAPRGTYDLLPEEAVVRRVIVHQAEQRTGHLRLVWQALLVPGGVVEAAEREKRECQSGESG